MAERQWADAAMDFFEAFKNYDEAGTHRRIQCLKLVSVNTLTPHFVVSIDLFTSFWCHSWNFAKFLYMKNKVMQPKLNFVLL